MSFISSQLHLPTGEAESGFKDPSNSPTKSEIAVIPPKTAKNRKQYFM
jgi:hypothetical protein